MKTYPPDLVELFRACAVALAARAVAQAPNFQTLAHNLETGRVEVRVVYDIRRGVIVVGLVHPDGRTETLDLIEADTSGVVGASARDLGLLGSPERVH